MSKSDFGAAKTTGLFVNSPEELRKLPADKLPELADSLRREIISSVAANGGHLASSLGAVELIIALHRVFDTPQEKLFFDVGHQAYAHKLLTGRRKDFASLRQNGGISGFPFPEESPYDTVVCGHAGCAVSAALGYAAADPGNPGKVIAVVGDGAAGCGVNFEALNNTSHCPGKEKLIVILNDNQMSISRNVGALTGYFSQLISGSFYNRFRSAFKALLRPVPKVSRFIRSLHEAVKSIIVPPGIIFGALGFRYFGPANGHDLDQLVKILSRIRKINAPVLLHVVTEKGRGCDFAAEDPVRYHGVSGYDENSGSIAPSRPGFSSSFGEAMVKIAAEDPELVAVCAAMIPGTGLSKFAALFPERCFDAGIAEAHAVAFAAALAGGGKHPVCAMYDTFLQRALDEVYHDVLLAKRPLVIIADRAGAVEDGPTHHGIYNCGFLRALPGLTIMCPACCEELESALRFALSLQSPVVIRYPRGSGTPMTPRSFTHGKAEILRSAPPGAPVIWAVSAEVATALAAAELLDREYHIQTTVVDARFLKPFDKTLALSLANSPHWTIEDHCVTGGLYSALAETLCPVPHGSITPCGWPDDRIIGHGSTAQLRREYGFNAADIAAKIAAATL